MHSIRLRLTSQALLNTTEAIMETFITGFIVLGIAFLYINIGYSYAISCVLLAKKNFLDTSHFEDENHDHRIVAIYSTHWYMFLVFPYEALLETIGLTCVSVATGGCLTKEAFQSIGVIGSDMPSLHTITLNHFAQKDIKEYTVSMTFLWPAKLFWIFIVILLSLVFATIFLCVAAIIYAFKKLSLFFTWPIRKATGLNHL